MFIGLSGYVVADTNRIEPIELYYLIGDNTRQLSIDELISHQNAYRQKRYDGCVEFQTQLKGPNGDWNCDWESIENYTPLENSLTLNEKASEYSATGQRKIINNIDDDLEYELGPLRIAFLNTCPDGYGLHREDHDDGSRSEWCERQEYQSCRMGNPIDVASGDKYEFETDYQSKTGLLNLHRSYQNQHQGWSFKTEPRLVLSRFANESDALSYCTIYETIEYDLTTSEPNDTITVPKTICRSYYLGESIYVWLNGKFINFQKQGNNYKPQGGHNGRLEVKPISIDAEPNAAWLLTHRNGNRTYFDEKGFPLATYELNGGFVRYEYEDGLLKQKTDHTGRSLVYHYNQHRQLRQVQLPTGGFIHYRYIGEEEGAINYSLIDTVTWPDGKSIRYTYNEVDFGGDPSNTDRARYLTGKFDSFGNRIGTYHYNSSNSRAISTEGFNGANKISISGLTNTSRSYTIQNSLGLSEAWYFGRALEDGTRRLTEKNVPTTDASAENRRAQTRYTYDTEGRITKKTDANGNISEYAYHSIHGFEQTRVEGLPPRSRGTFLGRVTLPAGAVKTTTQWDLNLLKPTAVAAPGVMTTYVYNGQPDPFNNNDIASCSPAPFGDEVLPLLCREVQQATQDLNGENAFDAELDPATAAREWVFTYDALGNPLTRTRTFDNATTTYIYYDTASATHKAGDLQQMRNALGHTVDYLEYDAHGNVTLLQDENGIQHRFMYDAVQRLTHVITAVDTELENTTEYQYDLNGNLITAIQPSGAIIHYEYDPNRRLTAMADGDGNRIELTLDTEGNILEQTIQDHSGTLHYRHTQVFDGLSRLMTATGNHGQSTDIRYDGNNNPIENTNAKAHTTAQAFDALNRLQKTTDADGGEITYSYDAQDRITSVTDQRGLKTEYRYNGFGDLIELISPDTGTTVFEYDNAGNQIAETNANGIRTEYRYDALNRLTDILYPSDTSQNITYRYDTQSERNFGIGQLTHITDASGTTQYTYDHLGGVATKNVVADGNRYGISYRYNDAGQLALMRYHSGRLVYFYYDNQGRVNRIQTRPNGGNTQNLITHIAYQPFGPVNHFEYGNGLTKTLNYDLDYRLENLTIEGNATTLARNYVYDLTNNITGITDADGEHNEVFDYDRLDRLSSAEGNLYGTQIFDYDGVGNRIELTHTHNDNIRSERYTYADNANQLKTIEIDNNGELTARSFEHDANGNTIEDTQNGTPLTIEYGANNRPTEFSKGNNTQIVTHNAMGQRVKWDTNGEANYHHYDENGQLIAITDAAGQTLREYIYFGAELIALATYENNGAENLYYIHTNHLGTPQRITNADQRVVWSAEYEPFGAIVVESDEVDVDFKLRFPGQYEDEITGLNYNWHRDYDASIGRYVQSDPLGLYDGPNTYSYVGGNPINYYDPYGLWAIGDPLPQGLVDFSAGFGDTLGAGYIRDALGIGGVNKCSLAYLGGGLAGASMGPVGRVGYVVRVSSIPARAAARGGNLSRQINRASRYRKRTKEYYRGGNSTPTWREFLRARDKAADARRPPKSPEQQLAGAGRTNKRYNQGFAALGAAGIGAAVYRYQEGCGCNE
ncbi:hypothetical protein GCM10007877_01810 [Marinibactrum halimedae]|uniref:Teneurin-like YD-shell domain-containing protein n=2 Tax=Marinibactrum halimedae TaxID=1444977 RepID=A0AA37WKR4_9GAMM|nr:hypothetical protein GCM10007877_01810 [Marinibactrum halimedae]